MDVLDEDKNMSGHQKEGFRKWYYAKYGIPSYEDEWLYRDYNIEDLMEAFVAGEENA